MRRPDGRTETVAGAEASGRIAGGVSEKGRRQRRRHTGWRWREPARERRGAGAWAFQKVCVLGLEALLGRDRPFRKGRFGPIDLKIFTVSNPLVRRCSGGCVRLCEGEQSTLETLKRVK